MRPLAVYIFYWVGLYFRSLVRGEKPSLQPGVSLATLAFVFLIVFNEFGFRLHSTSGALRASSSWFFIGFSEIDITYVILIWFGVVFGLRGICFAVLLAVLTPILLDLVIQAPRSTGLGTAFGSEWVFTGNMGRGAGVAMGDAIGNFIQFGLCALVGDELRRQIKNNLDSSRRADVTTA